MTKQPLWKTVQSELSKGRTFSCYPTGNNYGYDSYYRWDDNKEVIPLKTVNAMINRNLIKRENIKVSNQVIPYNPYF